MPDFWLEVHMHARGSAPSQIERRFPWFSQLVTQILSCQPDSTLHCALLMQLFRCEHQKSVLVLYHNDYSEFVYPVSYSLPITLPSVFFIAVPSTVQSTIIRAFLRIYFNIKCLTTPSTLPVSRLEVYLKNQLRCLCNLSSMPTNCYKNRANSHTIDWCIQNLFPWSNP